MVDVAKYYQMIMSNQKKIQNLPEWIFLAIDMAIYIWKTQLVFHKYDPFEFVSLQTLV